MRSPRALIALTLATALVVAGCSSGSDDDSTASTTTAPATTAAPSTTVETTTSEATTTTVATTTTTEPATAPTIDELQGAAIPALCQHPATTLVDGVDPTLSADDGRFELLDTLPSGPAHVVGVPSDAGPLTAVVAECNAGGVGWPNPILFFGAGGTFYGGTFLTGPSVADDAAPSEAWNRAWADAGAAAPGRSGVSSIALDGEAVVVTTSAELPDDSSCCPTGVVTVRIRPVGGRIEVVDLARTDAG